MSKNSEQFILDLPHREALGRDDFLVTSSNSAAVALIDQWPNWPTNAAIILGEEGSGKTHLVEVWRRKNNAILVSADKLVAREVPSLLKSGALAIEELQSAKLDERALFHVLNFAKQESKFLLLTSRLAPSVLPLAIPDLASRLKSLPIIQILAPDDALLRGVLVKLFMDRQISVEEGLINYILVRMPRSLGAARKLVADVDMLAMIEKAEVTKPLVARVLATLKEPDLFTQSSESFT